MRCRPGGRTRTGKWPRCCSAPGWWCIGANGHQARLAEPALLLIAAARGPASEEQPATNGLDHFGPGRQAALLNDSLLGRRGRAPRPTADGIVCVLQNRPASADSRVRTAVAVDAGARVAAGDGRGALVVVDAARNRFERVATLDARATALAWVGDRVACAVCHPRAPRLVAVDAATGTLSEVAAAHAPGTSIATLDARDRLVVTAARDAARFWTLDGDWLRQSAFEGAGAEVAAAAVGTDGNAVVLDRDGVVHLVDSSSGRATAQLSPRQARAPSRGVWCCLGAPRGAVVAGGPLLCSGPPAAPSAAVGAAAARALARGAAPGRLRPARARRGRRSTPWT